MTQSTFLYQVANKLLMLLQGYSKTIRLLLVMFLTLTVSANAWGADETATLSFANKAQRTSFSTTKQVWEQNGVTFTNDKASSTNAVADYANPVRLYANSQIIVAHSSGKIKSIVFDCNSSSYATALKNSIGSSASASSDKVTVTLDGTSNTFTVAKLTAQVRLDNITVTYATATTATEYNITYVGDDHITYSGTKPETITKEDGGFELEFSVNDGYQLDDVQVKMGGQNLVLDDDYLWEEGYLLILPETDITGDIVITFVTTSTCTTNPTVSAGSHSNVTTTTATVSCSGGITSLGSAGCSIESYGFVYGTSSNPTISNTKAQVGTTYTTTSTAFTKELTSLTANTTYYVRPYATNGNGTAYGTQTSFKTLELPKYTVTLNAGSGTCAASVTESSAGAGVNLPTPTICDGWTFAGWAEASVEETTTEPTLFKAGDNYKPKSDCELYAVYQRTEETEGTPITTNKTYTYTITAKTWSANGAQTLNSISWTLDNNGSYYGYDGTKGQQVGSSGSPAKSMTLTTNGFSSATKITAVRISTSGASSISGNVSVKVGSTSYTSGGNNTKSLTSTNTQYEFTGSSTGNVTISWSQTSSKAIYFKEMEVDYQTTAGGTITTTYYNSNPVCQTCENVLTISKGTESNGTFTLSKSGEIKTCDGVVDVVVTPIPAEHYHIGSVTATTPAEGGAPTMTDNDNGTYTITYAANSTGESTINVTFDEDAKATVILSELGETTTYNSTYYVGEQYTLPATTEQSCEGKKLVGWSNVEVVETDTKPTENYYELGATVTLEAEQTFYAVFAAGSGGNGGETTVNLSIKDYAVANSWVNATQYTTVNIDENVTVTAEGGGNTGKYYTTGTNWRLYQLETPSLTFAAEDGYTIKQITITYTVDNTGILTFAGSNITSGTACAINATSATFGVGNTGSATNGQVRISNISVTYSGSGGGYTDYSTSCGTYTVTFYGFNSGGYTTTCNYNPAEIAVAQGETYQIPNCEPTFDPAGLGRTFAGTWNTQANGKGTAYKPGDEFIVNSDITLYAQWALNTSGNTTLPTDVEDLATTDVVVTGGTTLTLQEGTTTINSLTLKGGRTTSGDYIMPSVYLEDWNGIELINDTIYFDLSVDMANYYPFAVPFPVAVNQVDYAYSKLANASEYATHYVIKRYDGANRAEKGENKDANWVVVAENDTLQPGIGYIITAVPIGGEALIRFPMTPEQLWSSEGKTVDVAAYTGAAAQQHPRHAGWNFVANPYLSRFAGVNVGNEKNLLNGVLNYVNGEWQKTGEVPYVTIPAPDFSYYKQVELDNAILSPSYAFFVQAAQNATLSFATAGRQQNMPALRAAAVEPLRLPLTISQSTQSDRTTLLVSDDYTANYEIGKDLEKMFGSAEQVSLYAWSSNTPLAYCAVPWASAIQAIPLGYRTNKSGSVTIALDASADMSDAEMVLLYDAVTGMTTNLLINSYTFETEMGTHDARFTITITPKQGATTDCEEVMMPTDGTYKFLRNGQLYINHRGTVYTVEGRENSRVRQ